MTLPLTIIGGYLGAGKTTLVNHLLRNADGLRLAVLVNEFGALPIDEDLIEAQDDDIISIAGGCVCCSYGNDLMLALMKLAELDPAPDHVLLEASGVAIPSAIAASVSLLQAYSMDGILVLANAETIEEQAHDTYVGDTVMRQLQDADLLILNKVDLVSDEMLQRVAKWVKAAAPQGGLVEARHGALPREILLQSFPTDQIADQSSSRPHLNDFGTESIDISSPVDATALASGLARPELGLIRAKGFVRASSGEVTSIQTVGRRWAIAPTPGVKSLGLVVIGLRSQIDMAAVQKVVRSAHC